MSYLRVTIGGIPIINNMEMTLVTSRKKLKIEYSRLQNEYYTIMMVDPDAPSKSNI
jgi:hypothetical protein